VLLVAIVMATVIGAVRLDDPWRALLIAGGVALAIAEATAIGPRIADGLLWLAAQLLPADGRSMYLRMWRADQVESVDGQGPISFALDVLLSGPLTAIKMRQSSQPELTCQPDLFGWRWVTMTVDLIPPVGCCMTWAFVDGATAQSDLLTVFTLTAIWILLREFTRPGRLFIQLVAVGVAVTSMHLPNYTAVAYGGWALACLLGVWAFRLRLAWSMRRTALLGLAVAVPVSFCGAFRWDYFGKDVAELLVCLVIAPMSIMLGRVLPIIACAPAAGRRTKVCYLSEVLAGSVAAACCVFSSFGWICAASLPSLMIGAVVELRRSSADVPSQAEDNAVVPMVPLA
jgi:hypothetical protein